MPRRRIAFDCRLMRWPGIGRYCRELARALPAAAPDLDFLWLCGPGQEHVLPRGDNARALPVSVGTPSLAEQWQIPRLLRREGIALLHAPTHTAFVLGAAPLVVTVHDLILLRFPEFSPGMAGRIYHAAMVRRMLTHASAAIAVSQFTRTDAAQAWPKLAARLRVAWNGVGASFQPAPTETQRTRVRAALSLPPEYLLYIGTRKRHKNLERLIEAYAGLPAPLRARFPLVLVAPDDARYAEVQETAHRRGLGGELRWRERVNEEDLPALYAMARALVLVSLYEGFGLPVVEANACGTPALVSRSASLPEVGGEACLTCDPYSATDITRQLDRLLTDDELHAQLAARAPGNAARFSWTRTAEQTVAVYREVLS